MLTHPTRARACELLHELHLARAVFGETRDYDAAVLRGMADEVGYVGALVGLLVARGHEPRMAAGGLIADARRALLLSNDERDGLRAAWTALGSLLTAWDGMGEATRKRLASGAGFGDAMAVLRSIEPGRGGAVDAEVARLSGRHGGLAPAALIDGAALIASGMRPGPSFSRLLDAVYDAQLEGRVSTRDEALAFAKSML